MSANDFLKKHVIDKLDWARKLREHHEKFIEHELEEVRRGSISVCNEMDVLIACCEAFLNQSKIEVENGDLLDRLFDLEKDRDRWKEDSIAQAETIQRMHAAAEDRNVVDKLLHAEWQHELDNRNKLIERLLNKDIPRDGSEVIVHLQSDRYTYVKWDAEMELWEETAGDMAYPDSEIVRWSPLHWTPMPGMPGSEL